MSRRRLRTAFERDSFPESLVIRTLLSIAGPNAPAFWVARAIMVVLSVAVNEKTLSAHPMFMDESPVMSESDNLDRSPASTQSVLIVGVPPVLAARSNRAS